MGSDLVRGNAFLFVMNSNLLNVHVEELNKFNANGIYYLRDFNAFVIYDMTHSKRYVDVARYMPTDWYFTPKIETREPVRPELPKDRETLMDQFTNYKLEDGTLVKDHVDNAAWYYIEYLSM